MLSGCPLVFSRFAHLLKWIRLKMRTFEPHHILQQIYRCPVRVYTRMREVHLTTDLLSDDLNAIAWHRVKYDEYRAFSQNSIIIGIEAAMAKRVEWNVYASEWLRRKLIHDPSGRLIPFDLFGQRSLH